MFPPVLGPNFFLLFLKEDLFYYYFMRLLISSTLFCLWLGKKIISSFLKAVAKSHFKKPLNGLILGEATTLFRVLRVALGILFIMVLQSTSQSKGLNLAIYTKENPLSRVFSLLVLSEENRRCQSFCCGINYKVEKSV